MLFRNCGSLHTCTEHTPTLSLSLSLSLSPERARAPAKKEKGDDMANVDASNLGGGEACSGFYFYLILRRRYSISRFFRETPCSELCKTAVPRRYVLYCRYLHTEPAWSIVQSEWECTNTTSAVTGGRGGGWEGGRGCMRFVVKMNGTWSFLLVSALLLCCSVVSLDLAERISPLALQRFYSPPPPPPHP